MKTLATYYEARHHYVEAMQIDPDTEVAQGGFLSPHEVSHAQIAGWLLGNGINDFRVAGEERPFGIQFLNPEGNPVTAEAGDWILIIGPGKLMKMGYAEFARMYQASNNLDVSDGS